MHIHFHSPKYLRLFRSLFLGRIIGSIMSILATGAFVACDSTLSDSTINFVGDSIIARWDINQDFPSYCVYNYGVGGSGIELLESYAHKFSGQDVVVISGTNDNHLLTEEKRENYAQRYISTILSLTNSNIYLFSLLPREFNGDRTSINDDIQAFNAIIQDNVKDIDRVIYIDIYSEFIKSGKINYAYFSDGLHPNSIGYEILTQKLLKEL